MNNISVATLGVETKNITIHEMSLYYHFKNECINQQKSHKNRFGTPDDLVELPDTLHFSLSKSYFLIIKLMTSTHLSTLYTFPASHLIPEWKASH